MSTTELEAKRMRRDGVGTAPLTTLLEVPASLLEGVVELLGDAGTMTLLNAAPDLIGSAASTITPWQRGGALAVRSWNLDDETEAALLGSRNAFLADVEQLSGAVLDFFLETTGAQAESRMSHIGSLKMLTSLTIKRGASEAMLSHPLPKLPHLTNLDALYEGRLPLCGFDPRLVPQHRLLERTVPRSCER